jgi:putative transposase
MMPRLRHVDLREFPYVVTTVTVDREPILKQSRAADIVFEAILFGKKQGWYYLLSFVIMPDHVHLIIIPEHRNISECMKSIKEFSAKSINTVFDRECPVRQGGFYDYILDSEEKVLSRMRYIEDNPARKGLVANPEDYGYSSIKYRAETDFAKFF